MHITYEVPVVPCNLRHEETIIQISDTLNYLNNVYKDIFDRINKRVEKYNNDVFTISNRITTISKKIDKLRGQKKATQIFSSSKYPAADIHKTYKSIFAESNEKPVEFKRTQVNYEFQNTVEQPLDKLQLYHVKVNEKSKKGMKNKLEDLEQILENIASIDELYLFNTNKNPYKNDVTSDPLQASHHLRVISQDKEVTGPDAAPLSISQKTSLQQIVPDTYFYSPWMGDVPDIDVPLDLPDLPGVADDLKYLLEPGPTIAPSVTTTPITSDPVTPVTITQEEPVVKSVPVDEKLELPPILETIQTESPTQKPSTITEILEQPKQSSDQTPTIEENIQEETRIKPEPSLIIPKLEDKKRSEPIRPAQLDVHASLMEAIRKVGGAKNLRVVQPNFEDKPKTTVSNDLMSDLQSKLVLRRRGISGTTNVNDSSSVMDKISALIEPPQANSELTESTNSDDEEDWD